MALAASSDALGWVQVTVEGTGHMTDRACCDDIIQTSARVKSLEDWRDEYIMSAQTWRDRHEASNRDDLKVIRDDLGEIKKMLTSFVNPVLAIVVSVLTAIIGLLAGALWVLAK